MYQILLENRAKRELKKLDKRYLEKVFKYLHLLEFNPIIGGKMKGDFKGFYRIKIPPLRIIYYPDFKNKIISIRAIGFRGDVYK